MAGSVQSNTVLREVEALFQRLTQELPSETADLRIGDPPGLIELTPADAAAARVSVLADESAVYTFCFGLKSYWEFPYERRYRYDEKSVVAEIEEMSRAVLAGHCEETRGLLSITGRIYVSDYTYKTTTLPIFRLPRFGTRKYAPYTGYRS